MKLQLTSTKTIEIGGGAPKAPTDVVGIELTRDDLRGCPAVRLQRRRKTWHVAAFGFVPPPKNLLPSSWEELESKDTSIWSLPGPFQASAAALAVETADATARQTTIEGICGKASAEKLGVVLDKPYPLGGKRFALQKLADEGSVLQAGLSEYQVIWLGRLLPEGRRPTVASVQIATFARVAALATQKAFREAEGAAINVIVSANTVHFAGWRNGSLVFLRQCPGLAGWSPVREAVKSGLSLDDALVDEIMDGSLVDPCFAMEPFVRPVLRELALSIDYMSHHFKTEVGAVYLTGLPAGGRYWSKIAAETSHISLILPNVFDGLEVASQKGDAVPVASQAFLAALGAARAAMEVPA